MNSLLLPRDLGCPQGDEDGSIEVEMVGEESVDNEWGELAPLEAVHTEWIHPSARGDGA